MPKTSIELREERATLVNEARKTLDLAEARDGGPNEEDSQSFDRAMAGADALLGRIERLEKLESAESGLDAPLERSSKPGSAGRGTEERATAGHGEKDPAKAAVLDFRHWMVTGEARSGLRTSSRAGAEHRDSVIGTASKGGYLITPVQISDDIVSLIQDQVYIRNLCTQAGAVTTVKDAQKLGIRQKTAHMAAANWTTEVAAVTEDTTMALNRRDLEPQLCTKLALVSIRALELSMDVEKLIKDELAYMFGITEENAFINGSGSGQPLGLYTASSSGISTGRDVPASSATAFTADDLINMKYSLKQAYQNDKATAWVISREFVKRARKLKVASTTGGNDLEYIWQPGITGGQPDRILDIPFNMSEYAPNTFTTGLYTAVLGCFRFYRIAQVADLMLQRLVERYADTNQVGFIGRRWVDGSPVLEEAFARLKQA